MDERAGSLDLSGQWRAAVADDLLRRTYAEPGHRDDSWESVAVPSHWRSTPAFADTDGPVLYRARFEDIDDDEGGPGAAADGDRRRWLVLDGVFYTSDVWLDGSYVGDTEGYFFPHAFEVTEAFERRSDHVLALEVGCAPPADRTKKRALTGVFQHADYVDSRWNPGGVWRPVRIERSGPVRIKHTRLLCLEAGEATATVLVRAVMDTVEAREVSLRTSVHDPYGREVVELVSDRQLAAGENRLEWTVSVPNPRLWWPWSIGDQPRYTVDVEVSTAAGPSDRRSRSVGLRQIALDRWIFRVNGERLFVKGSNQGPLRVDLGAAEPADFERDVRLAREANLDFLRVHGHISRPELYEAADVQGLLIWQDLPLQWGYARSVRRQARRQAREAVDLLAHHPSVMLWCGHNSPFALDPTASGGRARTETRYAIRNALAHALPTWNKSVLDHSVATVLTKSDPSRPVIAHSGVLPHLPRLAGTDTHWFFGWYHGEADGLARLVRWWPRVGRFVSEFGAQAVPVDAAFLHPERWPDLDWEQASARFALQKTYFDEHVPPATHASFEEWAAATQRYQSHVVRDQVHALRLRKYRPTGGFAQFSFADSQPAVSWSVLDHARRPKPAYDALRVACAPVIVTCTGHRQLQAGQPLVIDLFAVNDQRITYSDMIARLHLDWSQDESTGRRAERGPTAWRWQGELPADSCIRIARIETGVPERSRHLRLDIELQTPDGAVLARHHDEAPVRT